MGALGQVTCTFTINNQLFTQSFIVCRHMQQPVILGMDFTSTNFVGIIWTREGMRKMIRSNGSTVMELPDTTSGLPLVLARSIKIQPGGNLEVPLECTRQLTDQMDIRIDTGFHHKTQTYIYHLHALTTLTTNIIPGICHLQYLISARLITYT